MKKTTIIASAVALALGVSACSEQKSLEQLLASANEHSAKRDFGSAVIELKNAVIIAPKSAQARLALGLAYLEQGNYIFAEKELEKAQQLGVDPSTIAPALAQVKARLAKAEAVYQLVESSSDLNDEDYIIVLVYAGITALAENDSEKAQDYISQAIAINETSIYSKVGKAYLARLSENYAQGLKYIEDLLDESPNVAEAQLLKAHLLFALEDYELAATSFANYLEMHPMDYRVYYFEVDSLIKAQLFERAEAITDNLLSKFKKAPLALHYKAQLQYQKGLYAEAKAIAEQAMLAGADSAVTKLIAGASAYRLKDYEQAYNHLKPIERFLPNSHPIKKILAVIKLQLGYDAEAADSFIALEGLTNEDSNLLQSSTASFIAIGDFESAKKLIEKAEKVSPNNANLSAQKGFILLSQNDDEGIKSLERAIELDSSLTKVDLALGLQYLKANDISDATAVAERLIKEHEDVTAGYVLQGIIFSKTDMPQQAIASFNKALSIDSDDIPSLYNLALIKADLGDIDIAFEKFEQVLKLSPDHKGALKNYLTLAANSEQLLQTESFLKSINTENNLALNLALAQNLRLNEKTPEAIALLEKFATAADVNSQYWAVLGDSYLNERQFGKANNAFSKGLQLEPNNYFHLLRKIGALAAMENYGEALVHTRKAFELFPENDRVIILLAYYETKNKNTLELERIFAIAQQKQLNHHLLDYVAGHVAMSNKSFDKAVESFSSAYEKNMSDENAMQLARALKFNGQQQEAEKVLESYVIANPDKMKMRLLLAQLYDQNSLDKKIEQYLAINAINPDNIAILNNLAWNQYKIGQVADALTNIEKAYNLSSDNIAILETYGIILDANKQYEKAINILEQAISKGAKSESIKASLANAKRELQS